MSNPINLTYAQASRLYYELSIVPGVRQDVVGPKHNPTARTTAHVKPETVLYTYLKDNGWLFTNTVLVFHGTECSDKFKVKCNNGTWTLTHIPVG